MNLMVPNKLVRWLQSNYMYVSENIKFRAQQNMWLIKIVRIKLALRYLLFAEL